MHDHYMIYMYQKCPPPKKKKKKKKLLKFFTFFFFFFTKSLTSYIEIFSTL